MSDVLPRDAVQKLDIHSEDSRGLFLHFGGGLQAIECGRDRWQLLPVLIEGQPHAVGYFTKGALRDFCHRRGLNVVAIAEIGWSAGEFYSRWSPIIRGQTNHMIGPADSWGNIASHMRRATQKRSEVERLASSISLSLRGLNRTVEEIARFYSSELSSGMAIGRTNGHHFATSRDQGLYAMVHAFYLHLGLVRDYLGALIALELGFDINRIDSMARMIDKLRGPAADMPPSSTLGLLIAKGLVVPQQAPSGKWQWAGWLEASSELRKEFVHKRTYGGEAAEASGKLTAIDRELGLFRYYRPLGNGPRDVFDVIAAHYVEINALLFECAVASGHDASMLRITDADLVFRRTSPARD